MLFYLRSCHIYSAHLDISCDLVLNIMFLAALICFIFFGFQIVLFDNCLMTKSHLMFSKRNIAVKKIF